MNQNKQFFRLPTSLSRVPRAPRAIACALCQAPIHVS
jgi:hypothetical protein